MKRILLLVFAFYSIHSSAQFFKSIPYNLNNATVWYNPACVVYKGETKLSFDGNYMFSTPYLWFRTGYNPMSFFGNYEKAFGKLHSGIGVSATAMIYNMAAKREAISFSYALEILSGSSKLRIGTRTVYSEVFDKPEFTWGFLPGYPKPKWYRDGSLSLDAGAFYTDKKFYAGLSTIGAFSISIPHSAKIARWAIPDRTFYLLAGYSFNISPIWRFDPSIQLNSNSKYKNADLNLNFKYKKKAQAGITIEAQESGAALSVFAGYSIKNKLMIDACINSPFYFHRLYYKESRAELGIKYIFNKKE